MVKRSLEFMRQFDRNLWVLAFGWLVGSMGFSASMPFISIYFHSEYGMSMTQIGLFFGVLTIVRSLCQVAGGEISDRVPRSWLLIHSQLFRAFSFALIALAIYLDYGFWAVGGALLISVVFGAVFHPVANALVSDLLPKEKRLDGYAITRAAGNLGWAVGPAIGGFLVVASYDILFLISALITGLSALIFWSMFRVPGSTTITDRFRLSDIIAIRHDPWLARHSVLVFLLYLVVAQLIVPFSVYGTEITGSITKPELGYLFTLNGLMVVVLQIPVTRLLARFSLASQMAQGAFLYAIGYALVGWLIGFEYFALAIVIITSGEMVMSPPSLTIASRLAPEGRMGRYMGIYSFFVATGWSIGPLYGGTLLDIFRDSLPLAWVLISAAALLSGVGYLFGANSSQQGSVDPVMRLCRGGKRKLTSVQRIMANLPIWVRVSDSTTK